MKDLRVGESLWYIWEGEEYRPAFTNSIVYYTYDHVDLDNEVVRKALASSIQRDGISYSLSQSFQMINAGIVSQGWVGMLVDDDIERVCSESGETYGGEQVTESTPVTFVEVPELD